MNTNKIEKVYGEKTVDIHLKQKDILPLKKGKLVRKMVNGVLYNVRVNHKDMKVMRKIQALQEEIKRLKEEKRG